MDKIVFFLVKVMIRVQPLIGMLPRRYHMNRMQMVVRYSLPRTSIYLNSIEQFSACFFCHSFTRHTTIIVTTTILSVAFFSSKTCRVRKFLISFRVINFRQIYFVLEKRRFSIEHIKLRYWNLDYIQTFIIEFRNMILKIKVQGTIKEVILYKKKSEI